MTSQVLRRSNFWPKWGTRWSQQGDDLEKADREDDDLEKDDDEGDDHKQDDDDEDAMNDGCHKC